MTEAMSSVPYRVLFLCTHNSSRSQMAEGLLRARGGSAFPFSFEQLYAVAKAEEQQA